MPPISLPDDCIYDIVHYLTDIGTIYNCLFVNRFVCKSAIPLLWSEPLSEAGKKKKYLVRTYLSCLNDSELACLMPLNIDIFESTRYIPLFQYERYMKYFSNSNLEEGVREWLEMTANTPVNQHDRRVKQLVKILWHMFLVRSQNITSMSYDISISSSMSLDFPGLNISNIKSGLHHLQTIYLYNRGRLSYSKEFEDTLNFLKDLPIICSKIRDLHIYINEGDNSLLPEDLFSNIIMAQQGLSKFQFMGYIDSAGNIISSLSYQGNSLKKLVFTDIEFENTSLECFTNLRCLEFLDINNCFFSKKHNLILSTAFNGLVELSLVRNSLSPTTIASILKSSGNTLRKLKLDMITIEILQSSIEHCCNLNHLVISSATNFSSLFFRWIGKLGNLKILVFYDCPSKEIHTSEFICSVVESLSSTVYYLDLGCLIPKPEDLSYFLSNCKSKLTNFVLHYSQEDLYTHLIIVTEYAIKRQCLRSLTITYVPNGYCLGTGEIEYVRILGELGVKVATTGSYHFLNHHY